MHNDLAIILFSAIVAMVNPSLLAAVTVMLLLPNPKRLMAGYLLGAYTTSIVAGLLIVFSLHDSGAVRTSTHTANPSVELAVGIVALAVVFVLATGRDARVRNWRRRRYEAKAAAPNAKPSWQQRMLTSGSVPVTFVVGAVVSFPGVSYINALDHIAKLNPPTLSILLLVMYFCLMQQMLLELPLLATFVAPERTQDLVVRTKTWFGSHGRRIAMVGVSGLGILLATRGLTALA